MVEERDGPSSLRSVPSSIQMSTQSDMTRCLRLGLRAYKWSVRKYNDKIHVYLLGRASNELPSPAGITRVEDDVGQFGIAQVDDTATVLSEQFLDFGETGTSLWSVSAWDIEGVKGRLTVSPSPPLSWRRWTCHVCARCWES